MDGCKMYIHTPAVREESRGGGGRRIHRTGGSAAGCPARAIDPGQAVKGAALFSSFGSQRAVLSLSRGEFSALVARNLTPTGQLALVSSGSPLEERE